MSRRWVVLALTTVTLSLMPTVPASAAGPTFVTSHISTNTTWTSAGSPYIVNIGTLYVQPGVTLTIQPGVDVVMNQSLGILVVKGNLQALGTQAEPIVFTSGQEYSGAGGAKGQWRYISFDGAGTGTLDHVEIRYAGFVASSTPWNYSALWMKSSQEVWVTNSYIHDNNNSGILATANVPLHISSTEISNNRIGVSVVGTSNGVVEIDHSSLSNNSWYGLFVSHSATPVMQSFITQSHITGNAKGVHLLEANATPAEKYPTGDYNNIWNNNGGVDQLTLQYKRINPNENLWELNWWGGTFWLAPCPWALTTWQWHLSPLVLFPVSDKGPIQSMLWTKVDPDTYETTECRTDDMKVGTWRDEPYDWTVPGPPPPG